MCGDCSGAKTKYAVTVVTAPLDDATAAGASAWGAVTTVAAYI